MTAGLPDDASTAAAAMAVHRVNCDCDGTCADAPDEVDVEYATAALTAALPALTEAAAQAAAQERERIRQLAEDHNAIYPHPSGDYWARFADLLGGTADGAHPDGGAT